MFPDGHSQIRINPHTRNKKTTVLFYAVYLIGISDVDRLDDKTFQRILKEKLPYINDEEMIVDDEVEIQLRSQMLEEENYSEILEKGANLIKRWSN